MDIELHPLEGRARPLSQWLTTFPLATVALDPYTHESSWILDTALRILTGFRDADVRVSFTVAGTNPEGASRFLGPLADEILSFTDQDRSLVEALGLSALPAFVVVRQDGWVVGTAQGWDPVSWRDLANDLAVLTNWSRPEVPTADDPAPYAGTSALGGPENLR